MMDCRGHSEKKQNRFVIEDEDWACAVACCGAARPERSHTYQNLVAGGFWPSDRLNFEHLRWTELAHYCS
jgi:hypothetical protein